MLVVDRLALPDTTVKQDDAHGEKVPSHKIDEKSARIPIRRPQVSSIARNQGAVTLSVVGKREPPIDSSFETYREWDGPKEHVR